MRTIDRSAALARALACTVVAMSALVLVGWAIGSRTLVSVAPGLVSMKLNTAACLALVATSLVVDRGRAWLTVPVLGLVGVTLIQYPTGWQLGIDELVVRDFTAAPGGNPPGRMAVATGASLLLLALASLLQSRGARRLPQAAATAALMIGFVAVLGYAYGVSSLYAVVTYSTMAVHTATAIMLCSIALLARQPDGVLAWLLRGEGPGAVMGRWLTGLAALGIPVVGGLRLLGELAGWYDGRFGLALMVLSSTVAIMSVAVVLGGRLETLDVQRRAALHDLATLAASLRDGRDSAWERAERTLVELAEERARFSRSIAQADDQFCTVRVLEDGAFSSEFATPDPLELLTPLLTALVTGAALDADEEDPAARGTYLRLVASMRAGEPASAELHLGGTDGERHWVWVRSTPRREGEQLFCDLIATNVDERVRLTRQLEDALHVEQRARQDLEALDRMKDEFLAVAGHELRTPLAVISGNLELFPLLSDQAARDQSWDTITRRVAGMRALVDDLFDLARLRTGSIHVEPDAVTLRPAVEHAVADVVDAAAHSTVEVTVAHGDAELVLCDPGRLHQMLVNIVGNAVKYTPDDGSVRVVTSTDGDMVLVEVEDTGIGVPADEIDQLFQRFYRASTAEQHGIKGTGLGLAVTHALAEAQHGSLTARRRPESGMTFSLRLPVVPCDGDAPAA